MIAYLQGRLVEALPTRITVDVKGIGYDVLIPLSSFDKLPVVGNELKILTHLVVREDAHVLYGFMSEAERTLFRQLIQVVTGVGPKIALNVLSGISVSAFRNAVADGNVKTLGQISGIGRKTAERIVVELKDKVGGAPQKVEGPSQGGSAEDQKIDDAVQGLVALGFKPNEARNAVSSALKQVSEEARVDEIVRLCLKSTQ